MPERKAMMASLSDACVALPGGAGTLDEFFEAWTWTELGIHRKPVGLLDVAGTSIRCFGSCNPPSTSGSSAASTPDAVVFDADAGRLIDRLAAHSVVRSDKRLDRTGPPRP